MKKYYNLLAALLFLNPVNAQDKKNLQVDSLHKQLPLQEVFITVNKWEQFLNELPNKITKVSPEDIIKNNSQTAADLLAQTGAVFIQKSQLGGGSPIIRGFAANRLLIVVDGVRMNNAIYRSGNLQNIISIDPHTVQTAEIIFGPGAVIYGSDAIGAVMDFHSLEPRFSNTRKILLKGNAFIRYSSANNENTFHTDFNFAKTKWSFISSISHSNFGDLTMGKHGGQDSYLRHEYIQRINGIDSIVKNKNPRIQKYSGYNQINLLQKLRYRFSENLFVQYAFTYSATGTVPRYDRLLQYQNAGLRYAEWNYGPMVWSMHQLQMMHTRKNYFYHEARLTIAYQHYNESRIERIRNNNKRLIQAEKVDAVSLNWDASKAFASSELFYGVEYVYNKVGSRGKSIKINSGESSVTASRYPDGSTWVTAGLYSSYKLNLHKKFTLTAGLRYSFNYLKAQFDTSIIKFPYQFTRLEKTALTGNAGLVYRPDAQWQLNANLSSGYRMPNIDDIGKLFENSPGNINVPNPNLQPEYAWNMELGIIKETTDKIKIEFNAFYTFLKNAIVQRPSTFNGLDSMLFNGTLNRVQTLQNAAYANLFGWQVSVSVSLLKNISFQSDANWTTGTETEDKLEKQVPLRHAPPFYGSSALKYKNKKWYVELNIQYNSSIKNKDLAPSEQVKPHIYAADKNGRPWSPGWFTINAKGSFDINKNFVLNVGFDNISNQLYRSYSSGIVAPGSNFIVSLRASL